MFEKKKLQAAIAIACMGATLGAQAALPAKPNFVTIIIDDAGFSDLSAFGGEIDTPNLDDLVGQGVQLTNFYSAPTSTPARAMFFTGRDNHPAGVGNMAGFSADRPPQIGVPGYEGVLTPNLPTFPELIRDNGYYTIMTGKWDLGEKPGQYASDRGFIDSLVLLPGGDVHFLSDSEGKLITSQPPSYYKGLGTNTPYQKNGVPFSDFPPNAFSTDFYTDEALKFVDARPDKSQPFYLNIAHISSHGPFQAPPDLIAKYMPIYEQGYDVLRANRFKKLKALGLVKRNARLPPRQPEVTPWRKLSADQKAVEVKRMAIYAGLVEKLDQSIGTLIQHLKDTGEYDNTVFFVMSDNGGAAIESGSPAKQAFVNQNFTKDSIEDIANMGAATSFIPPAPGLGSLSNSPFLRYKADTFEGGIHTAAFVFAPGMEASVKGDKYDCLSSIQDISATILDMTQTAYPTSYKGNPIPQLDGVSMSNIFSGNLNCPQPDRVLGFEQDSGKMLRFRTFKLSQDYLFDFNRWDGHVFLFDLEKDPFELRDLSKRKSAIYSQMLSLYDDYAQTNNVVDVGPRIFSSIADLKLEPSPGERSFLLGGSQVNYSTFQHAPKLPQAAKQPPGPLPAIDGPKLGDIVDIAAEIYPPASHQNQGAVVMVATFHSESNTWRSFKLLKNNNGHPKSSVLPLPNETADGSLTAPDFSQVPVFMPPLAKLPVRLELPIFEDKVVPTAKGKKPSFAVGTHYFWIAYKLNNGTVEYSKSPIVMTVADAAAQAKSEGTPTRTISSRLGSIVVPAK